MTDNYRMRKLPIINSLLLACALVASGRGPAAAQDNGFSDSPDMSANGRTVVFMSEKGGLVPSDNNGFYDIFLRDTATTRIHLISRTPTGSSGNGVSVSPSISTDGRYVAFASTATNLVPGDTNGVSDIFLLDRSTGKMRRISVKGSTQGNGDSYTPQIAGAGQKVVFSTRASNLIAGDSNATPDIVVWTRATGGLIRVSVTDAGKQANGASRSPSISNDGSRISFLSNAANLGAPVGGGEALLVRDTAASRTYRMDARPDGYHTDPALSGDGRRLGFQWYSDGSNWRIIAVPSGHVVRNQHYDTDEALGGIALNRDGTAHAVSVGGEVFIQNQTGSRQNPALTYAPAMSADGLRVAAGPGANRGIWFWDTKTDVTLQIDPW